MSNNINEIGKVSVVFVFVAQHTTSHDTLSNVCMLHFLAYVSDVQGPSHRMQIPAARNANARGCNAHEWCDVELRAGAPQHIECRQKFVLHGLVDWDQIGAECEDHKCRDASWLLSIVRGDMLKIDDETMWWFHNIKDTIIHKKHVLLRIDKEDECEDQKELHFARHRPRPNDKSVNTI